MIMSRSLREVVATLKENPKTVEILAVGGIFALIHVFVIGPTIGKYTGFDTPVVTLFGHRAFFTLSVRTVVFFAVVMGGLYGYIYIKPRLFGDDPGEYWEMSS